MQPLFAVWSALDPRRRMAVGAATLITFVVILLLSRMATTPQMALLYSGLESGAAGEVIAALEQQAVQYEVRGSSIFVETTRRDELRLTLAGQGLPATGGAGYELLDSLSGFGTTSQMFDAAYWRAKEGELARTIVSNPAIKSARVHIATASNPGFGRNRSATASVTLVMRGATLSAAQARALQYMVASSVANLSPADVSIIDGTNGLLVSGNTDAPAGDAKNRADNLRQNVERLLAARMGPNRAVVEVSLETVTDRESVTERRFDPDSRVAISTDSEERSNSSRDQDGAAVTVASNLPQGDGGADRNSSSSSSETRERVNFEVSETRREILRIPGAIKRLSVAVLVDGVRIPDASGTPVWQPLPDPELSALRELVASAVGFDQTRGDVITLKSMPFEPVAESGTQVSQSMLSSLPLDIMSLIQLAVLAAVVLVLGLFVVRPVLMTRSKPARIALAAPAGATSAKDATQASLSGEINDGYLPAEAINGSGAAIDSTRQARAAALPPPSADPVERLRQMIENRREETVEILRNWMEEEERA